MTDDHVGAGPERVGETCPQCEPPLLLGDGRTLVVRHLVPADRDDLRALYRRLAPADLRRRFFTGGPPPDSHVEHWVSLPDVGGLGLAVELIDGDEVRFVGEAGYAPLDDGDAELGITVDRANRGWLGPWLLNSLLNHARHRGVDNLQAVVMTDNRAMLALAEKRGFVVRGHPDWGKIRLSMATEGQHPSWGPPDQRPRVVVETTRSRWVAEDQFRQAGFDIALCLGPCRPLDRCPVMAGEPCPLVAGADAVVVDLEPSDPITRDLLAAEAEVHPGVRLVAGLVTGDDGVTHHRRAEELLAELADLAGRADTQEGTMGPERRHPQGRG